MRDLEKSMQEERHFLKYLEKQAARARNVDVNSISLNEKQ
jgi:hypothetical protein